MEVYRSGGGLREVWAGGADEEQSSVERLSPRAEMKSPSKREERGNLESWGGILWRPWDNF